MEQKAFEGAVTFDITAPNMRTMIVREAMERAIPESEQWPVNSVAAVLFSNLIQFLGRTAGIDFLDFADPQVDVLAGFWHFTSTTTDYRAIWDAFILMPPEINNQWMAALNPVDDVRLKAPDIVQPGAPSDDDLEALGEEGKKKSSNVTPTSKRLTTGRVKSQPSEATLTP